MEPIVAPTKTFDTLTYLSRKRSQAISEKERARANSEHGYEDRYLECDSLKWESDDCYVFLYNELQEPNNLMKFLRMGPAVQLLKGKFFSLGGPVEPGDFTPATLRGFCTKTSETHAESLIEPREHGIVDGTLWKIARRHPNYTMYMVNALEESGAVLCKANILDPKGRPTKLWRKCAVFIRVVDYSNMEEQAFEMEKWKVGIRNLELTLKEQDKKEKELAEQSGENQVDEEVYWNNDATL